MYRHLVENSSKDADNVVFTPHVISLLNQWRWTPYEGRLSIELVEAQILLLSDCLGQSSAGNKQLLQLGLLPVIERAERRTLESLVLCRDGHVDNFPNTENSAGDPIDSSFHSIRSSLIRLL